MPDLGTKWECFSCGVKFYDLGRPEPLCPKCGADQRQAKSQETTADVLSARRRKREESVLRELEEDDRLAPDAEAEFDADEDEEVVGAEETEDEDDDLDDA